MVEMEYREREITDGYEEVLLFNIILALSQKSGGKSEFEDISAHRVGTAS